MKKFATILLAASLIALSAFAFVACNGPNLGLLEENIVDDMYDNYYEIFAYSYKDTDGDGVGDLNGVRSKLGYIRDMGYTAIWLTPIYPALSYHGYDVRDYKDISPFLGNMQDFDALLADAHAKGIKIILDLVVNHTSSDHPWFKSCMQAYINGDTESKYREYYNVVNTAGEVKPTGYEYYNSTSYAYEARFTGTMPDLNLDSEFVRAEISDIIKFWMQKGVDGFRLDACTSYYTGRNETSAGFVKWIKQEAVKYNKDAYIVGEVWEGAGSIKSYYDNSDSDSFFWFPASTGGTSFIASVINADLPKAADSYWNGMIEMQTAAGDHIAAPFLDNHDTGRIAGAMYRMEERVKFAYGLASMLTGNLFTYYGDEIGMVGSASDPDKRIGMLWDNKRSNITDPPPGSGTQEYIFDGVKEQLKDGDSILNYYKQCNNVRNAFPAIMRGTPERIPCDDPKVLIMKKDWNGQSVTIVINFAKEAKSVEAHGTLQKGICVEGNVKQNGGALSMPKYSIAILA